MDPEHARPSTGVDEFWDDDDNTSADYYTPLRAQPEPIEPVGAPRPPSRLDTNWWDEDTQDALWDAAESAPPAHAPIRAVDGASIGAWSPVLEPRPPWYRTRPAAIALIIAAAAAGSPPSSWRSSSPAADEQDPPSITPTRPSVATIEPAPSATLNTERCSATATTAPPPPPPPPSAEQISPPSGGGTAISRGPAPPHPNRPTSRASTSPEPP